MHEVTYQTELGQMLDLITAPDFDVDLSKFTLAKYKCIVKYKTAFYSFYCPVAMGMMMAGILDLSLILTTYHVYSASFRHTHDVCHAHLSVPVYRMLVGACNPTVYLIQCLLTWA